MKVVVDGRLDEDVYDEQRLLLIAKRVRHIRQKQGFSQEELASAADVSSRTIKTVEAGVKASLETYRAIASVLEYDMERLISIDFRHYVDDLAIFVDAFFERYSGSFSQSDLRKDGLIDQVFGLDSSILDSLDKEYFRYGNRPVTFFNAIGLYLKHEIDDYLAQLEGLGLKREQALAFLHLFYLVILRQKTTGVGFINADKMSAFYREVFDRHFPR